MVIKKKLKLTIVKYVTTVVEDGAAKMVPMPDKVFPGTVSENRIRNLLRRELGDTSFTIVSVLTNEKLYEMPLGTFVANATVAGEEDQAEETSEETAAEGGVDAPESADTEGV